MVKLAVCADVHWSQYSSIIRKRGPKYSTRLHNLIESVNWFESEAEKENCDQVLYLGDTFDRSDLNAEEITALQEVNFCDKPHVFLTGNHEANVASLDFSTAKLFESTNAEVITTVKRVPITDKVDMYFLPYMTSDSILPIKNYLQDNDKKKLVFSHNDISGIYYGRVLSQSGFNVNDILDNCTLYINGHLHNSCILNDRIVLVGNLTGQNFNENAKEHKHYMYIITIDDDGNITLEPKVNPHAFSFYKIYVNTDRDLSQLDNLDQNAVLSIICDNSMLQKVENRVTEIPQVIAHKLIVNYNNYSCEAIDDISFEAEDYLQQFISYAQTKIEASPVLTEELTKIIN